jgi:cell division septation protein DedD
MGTILLATAAVVGLTFAMGVVVGQAAEPDTPKAKDPLAQLEAAAVFDQAKLKGPAPVAAVKAADLTFPKTLAEEVERPEVLAALEAAALEEASLAEPADEPSAGATLAQQEIELENEPVEAIPEQAYAAPDDIDAEHIASIVPAAVAAGSGGRNLPRSIKHDPLVAQAIAAEPRGERAPRGSDGEYTLQVISYDSEEPARDFAEGLRSRGHEAFVTQAEIPERGRYYRVRIGPFENRAKAETYRRKFEQEERMNTFVVRKRD